MTFVYIIGGIVAVWVIAAMLGVGSKTVLRNPSSLTDAQLERTIRLSARIMDNSKVGTKEWSEAGAKHDAAFKEQQRRQGIQPVTIDWSEYDKHK